MKQRFVITALAAAGIIGMAAPGEAQNTYKEVNIFATGEAPPLDGFGPGGTPGLQLRDDGTLGDATSGDKIYSVDFPITSSPAATLNQRFQWKVASQGFSPVSYPFGTDNSFSRFIPGNMKFVFDANTKNDGYIPDPNDSSILGILYTVPPAVVPGDSVRATGSFLSELSGNDWDAGNNASLMNDSGTTGDLTANDGIYTFAFTGVPAGSYEFKITINGSFDMQVSSLGYATGGSNLGLNISASTDNVKILFDSTKGRVKVLNDNPLVNPGPPFYGTSTAWATSLGPDTQLYDDGTHGDVTSADGIHSRVFTSNAAGSFTAQVKQGVGPSYPGTGGYPIDVVTTGQLVLLQFDTNTLTDGYSPSTRYMWTDPASRHVPDFVQAVGSFMDEFGGADWSSNDPNFNLSDAGSNGDLVAADKLFGLDFQAFAQAMGASFKAVIPPTFEFQFGGPGDGYTRNGNNPAINFNAAAGATVNFQVDSITGRINVFVNTTATAPQRPPSINALALPANVSDWAIY